MRKRVAVALVAVAALPLAGCSGLRQTMGGWFGGTPSAAAGDGEGSPYYAGEAGLVLRDAPSRSGKVIGKLALHEKVLRTDLQEGWAYVTSTTGGQAGWVDNAKLVWRLPAAASPDGTAATAVPAAVAPTPTVTPATDAPPAPPAPEPAVFDPF